jgi:hypothetical protein
MRQGCALPHHACWNGWQVRDGPGGHGRVLRCLYEAQGPHTYPPFEPSPPRRDAHAAGEASPSPLRQCTPPFLSRRAARAAALGPLPLSFARAGWRGPSDWRLPNQASVSHFASEELPWKGGVLAESPFPVIPFCRSVDTYQPTFRTSPGLQSNIFREGKYLNA